MDIFSKAHIDKFFERLLEMSIEYIPRMISAIILLIVGLWLIKRLTNLIRNISGKPELDPTLRDFLIDLSNVGLKAMLFLSSASMLGIATTSFVAVLGAASLAVGLALQGSLANFAGGVLILLFRPFRIGDTVEVGGQSGDVTAINIFVTTLRTRDNRLVIVPNGTLSNNTIINYSALGSRRLEIRLYIDYGVDFRMVRDVLLRTCAADNEVQSTPEPDVIVREMTHDGIVIVSRCHVPAKRYYVIADRLGAALKLALDDANIELELSQEVIIQSTPPQSTPSGATATT